MRKFFLGWVLPLLIAVAVMFVLWLVYHNRIYKVGGDAMSPTLQRGQTVLVSYDSKIRRGDIVLVNDIFAPQGDAVNHLAFTRCVGLPGDTLKNVSLPSLYKNLVLPRRGMTVVLNYANYMIYKDLMERYEGVNIEWRNGGYYVDGRQTLRYMFKRSYVYLSNDNGNDLADSRSFGPVPSDVISGKIALDF